VTENEAIEKLRKMDIRLEAVKPGDIVVLKHAGEPCETMLEHLKVFSDQTEVRFLLIGRDIDEMMVVEKVMEVDTRKSLDAINKRIDDQQDRINRLVETIRGAKIS